MTVSFHKYGEFFPGTGDLCDVGHGRGKNYSVNFPLKEGIDDESYRNIFCPIIQHVMDFYRPGAIVLQMGADSLSGDRLGCFNLSMSGHAQALQFVKSFNVPVMVLGGISLIAPTHAGGGYTIRNVARAWTYETAMAVGETLPEMLPFNDYLQYYGPDFRLEVPSNNMENMNSRAYLEKVTYVVYKLAYINSAKVIENLRSLTFAPSVQMQQVPRDAYSSDEEEDAEEDANKDKRINGIFCSILYICRESI